jgi:hypothetical protein
MKRAVPVLLVSVAVFAASCGEPVSSRQVPAPSATTSAQPASPPAAPAAPAGCRLPITLASTSSFQGAFLSYPSGQVTIDPNGGGGRYYDRAFSRWLPVDRAAVSADESHYAYSEPAPGPGKVPKVHLVDLRTGEDRAFDTPSSQWFISYIPLAYASDGIYLGQAWESPVAGLWRLDPSSGALSRVANVQDLQVMASSSLLWVGNINLADPHPLGALYTSANQVDRMDRADGSRKAWFYRPGTAVSAVGLDANGHPIVKVVPGQDGLPRPDLGGELLLLKDERTQVSIFKGPGVEGFSTPLADSRGLWFGGPQGIYLYSEGAGFQKVSDQAAFPAGSCA